MPYLQWIIINKKYTMNVLNYVQKILFYNIILDIKFKIIFYFKNLLSTFSFYPLPHGLPLHIMVSIPTNRNRT
jgi:hypothetical protein